MRKIYRAMGIYEGHGREAFVTNVWRRTKEEAEQDIKLADRFSNTSILEKDFADFVNMRKKLKFPLPKF